VGSDLTITLDDRPGEFARVGEALGGAGINIDGVSGIGFEGRGIIHILVENAAAARTALESAGIKVEGEADAVVMDLGDIADTPGAGGMMARKLSDAGVNIRALYLATKNRGVLVTDDNAKARQALGM
jgi:hypothetical protein